MVYVFCTVIPCVVLDNENIFFQTVNLVYSILHRKEVHNFDLVKSMYFSFYHLFFFLILQVISLPLWNNFITCLPGLYLLWAHFSCLWVINHLFSSSSQHFPETHPQPLFFFPISTHSQVIFSSITAIINIYIFMSPKFLSPIRILPLTPDWSKSSMNSQIRQCSIVEA